MKGIFPRDFSLPSSSEQNEWKQVVSSELLRVTQLEGQPWLALYSLTTSKTFRESYGLDEYRKSQLMKVRKYIHESILDQFPVLGEVATTAGQHYPIRKTVVARKLRNGWPLSSTNFQTRPTA